MDDLVVAGVDIRSGSPRSKQKPLYSISIMSGEEAIFEDEEVTLEEIFSLMRKFNVTILATDNLYELAEDAKALRNVIDRMPPGSKLVQVTGSPQESMPLSSVVKEAGLPSPSHRDSLQTARTVARLAQRGVGVEVVAMYPETRVLITKNRSMKQGGSGSDRWRRSIEASILSEANRIATELDAANLDYDLYVERAAGGLRRAEFIVYAGFDDVRRVVKESSEWTPLRIAVKQSWRRKIKFPSVKSSPLPRSKPIIVGIDPGMSVGLAILDLNGEVMALRTLRRASRSEIVEEILNHGYPVIIATDVSPPPKSVTKIAGMFDSRLMVAKYDMRADEKRGIVAEYEETKGIRVGSSHERDSLAAALKVYYKVKNLISKVRIRVIEEGLTNELDTVLTKVLKGTPITVAIEEARSEKEDEKEMSEYSYAQLKRELRRMNKYARSLIRRIEELRKDLEKKRLLLEEKDREILDLRKKIEMLEDSRSKELEADRRISARDARIKELERELDRERWRNEILRSQMRQMITSGSFEGHMDGLRLTVIPSLSKEKVNSLLGRKVGGALLALDATGASLSVLKRIKELGINAVLYRGNPPPAEFVRRAEEEGIVVASLDGFRLHWKGIDPILPTQEALRLLSTFSSKYEGVAPKKEGKLDESDVMSIVKDYRMSLLKVVRGEGGGATGERE